MVERMSIAKDQPYVIMSFIKAAFYQININSNTVLERTLNFLPLGRYASIACPTAELSVQARGHGHDIW